MNGRKTQARGSAAQSPQCRFKVASKSVLDSYHALARRYGYDTFTAFMLDLMEAARRGDATSRVIRMPLPDRGVPFEQRLAS